MRISQSVSFLRRNCLRLMPGGISFLQVRSPLCVTGVGAVPCATLPDQAKAATPGALQCSDNHYGPVAPVGCTQRTRGLSVEVLGVGILIHPMPTDYVFRCSYEG